MRDVPEDLHRVLKARAAAEGMSLSDYIKRELERVASKPTLREWLSKTEDLKPLLGGSNSVELIRTLRESR